MDALYQLRFFDPERDYPLLKDWFEIHGSTTPPVSILPKLGAVCTKNGEPAAMLFLYMDNSVGVCRMEFPVSKPKMSLKDTRTALRHLLVYMRRTAKELNYGVMFVTTFPAMARYLEKEGFRIDRTNLVSMVGSTEEEDDHGHGS
jgi:hypothetical protein